MDFADSATAADYLEYFLVWTQFAVYAVCAVIAFLRADTGGSKLTYRLVAGAFACYAAADMFVGLYLSIYHVYPHFFSVAELAWISTYVFLAAVCLHKIGGLSEEEHRVVKKYRLASSLISALVIIPFYTVFIALTPEYILNHLLYAAAQLALLYPTLLLLFAGVRDKIKPQSRDYHIAALLCIAFGLLMFLFSSLYESPLYNLFFVFEVLQTAMPFVILYTLKKGAAV